MVYALFAVIGVLAAALVYVYLDARKAKLGVVSNLSRTVEDAIRAEAEKAKRAADAKAKEDQKHIADMDKAELEKEINK